MKAPKKVHRGNRIIWEPPDKEWLEYQYHVLGKTQKQIAIEIGSHPVTVKRWVKQYGLHKSPEEWHCRQHDVPSEAWLREQYLWMDKSIRDIADEKGCSIEPVQRWLRIYGIEKSAEQLAAAHSKRMTGRGNPAWVNGASRGYQFRKLEQSGKPKVCEWCGTDDNIQIHHRDHDRDNHDLDNLTWLCGYCNRLEAQLWALQEEGRVTVKFNKEHHKLEITFRRL